MELKKKKNLPEWGNTDPKRQVWYVRSYMWLLACKPSVGMLLSE